MHHFAKAKISFPFTEIIDFFGCCSKYPIQPSCIITVQFRCTTISGLDYLWLWQTPLDDKIEMARRVKRSYE